MTNLRCYTSAPTDRNVLGNWYLLLVLLIGCLLRKFIAILLSTARDSPMSIQVELVSNGCKSLLECYDDA